MERAFVLIRVSSEAWTQLYRWPAKAGLICPKDLVLEEVPCAKHPLGLLRPLSVLKSLVLILFPFPQNSGILSLCSRCPSSWNAVLPDRPLLVSMSSYVEFRDSPYVIIYVSVLSRCLPV